MINWHPILVYVNKCTFGHQYYANIVVDLRMRALLAFTHVRKSERRDL